MPTMGALGEPRSRASQSPRDQRYPGHRAQPMVVFDMPLASGRLAQDRCSKEKAWHARLQMCRQRP